MNKDLSRVEIAKYMARFFKDKLTADEMYAFDGKQIIPYKDYFFFGLSKPLEGFSQEPNTGGDYFEED